VCLHNTGVDEEFTPKRNEAKCACNTAKSACKNANSKAVPRSDSFSVLGRNHHEGAAFGKGRQLPESTACRWGGTKLRRVEMAEMMELSGADLDAVAGGAQGGALAAGGLVNVALGVGNINVLNDSEILKNIDINDVVDIKDVANNNNVSVGAIIQLLGGGAAVLTRQVQ
jgi:hypothetical protein